MGRQSWSGEQSGVPGCWEVDDYGRVNRLIVHSAYGCIHIGGGPVRHDTIAWKGSTHLSDQDLELSSGCGSYMCSSTMGRTCVGQATAALKPSLLNGNDTKKVVLSLPGGPAEVTTHMQCLGQCMSREKRIVSHCHHPHVVFLAISIITMLPVTTGIRNSHLISTIPSIPIASDMIRCVQMLCP